LLNDESSFLEGLALAIIIILKLFTISLIYEPGAGWRNLERLHVWSETESPTVCLSNGCSALFIPNSFGDEI